MPHNLYDFDYQSDNIVIIQALLLLSHYYSQMVEQKHTRLWVLDYREKSTILCEFKKKDSCGEVT